ncbi:hypothetical protein H0H93_002816, partial [Arthromyces matolae]
NISTVFLPKTDPDLYDELNRGENLEGDIGNEPDEPAFDSSLEDDSDVPLDVVCDVVATAGSNIASGFTQGDDGEICRSSTAEDTEAQFDNPDLAEGRPTRKRKAPKLFGGEELWEAY